MRDLDHESMLEVLADHDPAFRRGEALIALRRTIRDLCRQAVISNMPNAEAVEVMVQIGTDLALINRIDEAHAVETCERRTRELAIVGNAPLWNPWSSEAQRLVALAEDAYAEAAKALALPVAWNDETPNRKAS